MAFFDKLAKKVSKGLEQATFEAEKLVRLNKLKIDLSALRKELLQVKATLADQVMEMHEAGSLNLPELGEPIQAVTVLEERVAAQEDELLTAQAETYRDEPEVEMPAVPATPQAVVPVQTEGLQAEAPEAPAAAVPADASTRFCPECGTELLEGAVFCANCGSKVG